MNLLLIHGIAQGGKDPKALEASWMGALAKGLDKSRLTMPADVNVLFPYYGDVLDDFVKRSQLPADGIVSAKGPAAKEYEEFRARMALDIEKASDISEEEIRAEAGADVIDKGIQNVGWVLSTLRVLDRHLPGAGGWTIERFIREVFVYTKRDVVRARIDAIVTDLMDDTPTVIVGHSLGSVIAYNVAVARKPNITTLLLTVGSPLGLPAVRETVGTRTNPSGKPGWFNAYDPHDAVALYPLDKTHFGPVSPAIVNDDKVHNWTENRHGIIGYLDDELVAKTIHAALTA